MSLVESHPLIKSYIAHNHFGNLLDLKLIVHSKGEIEYRVTVKDKHLATPVAAHGGFLAALLDATVGVGALSLVCENDQIVSTINLNTTFLSAVYQGDELSSLSKLVKKGNRILFMEAVVVNQEGIEVAKASACLNVYPKEKGGY
jgi:uncharacterized protein (TIGR00369 family)